MRRFPLPPLLYLIVAASCLAWAGCSLFHGAPKITEPINLIAVLPIQAEQPVSATATDHVQKVPPEAPRQVTAAVYRALTTSSQWRVVPDLTVVQALSHMKGEGELAERAQALGKEVHADAVLFGTVSRYVEREGREYGARSPASVALTLNLISVSSGKTLWTGSFDQTQRPLSSNLFNWWQFWRGGPRWFTVQEFAHLGVEHLLEDLSRRVE